MRYLYHVMVACSPLPDPYAPESLEREGFIHASYQPKVKESASLYFPSDAELMVLKIDPRKLEAPVQEVRTPRGPMPHIHGVIPRTAVVDILTVQATDTAEDIVSD